jgi:D-xylulose reductase
VTPQTPLVMGHEASGRIHAIGPSVTSVSIGDSVAIEPGVPCRRCSFCKSGVYNHCKDIRFAAAPPDSHGMLTKFFLISEDFVYKIPEHVSLQEAVLIEPLAVAVHSARLADIKPGHRVVIIGSGTVGLLCAAVAQTFGAYQVILVDILQQKLDIAKSYLKCETFLSGISRTAEENSSELLNEFGVEGGIDVVIEASGAESSIQMGIHLLKSRGYYVQTGVGKHTVQVPILALSEKELFVRGCYRYGSGDYDLAVKLVSKGDILLKPLISSLTPFEMATFAWEKTAKGEGVKNLIQVF